MDRGKDKRAPGWDEAGIDALLKKRWDRRSFESLPFPALGGDGSSNFHQAPPDITDMGATKLDLGKLDAILRDQWDPHRLPISAFGGMVPATSTTAAAAPPTLTLEAANRMLAEFDSLVRESRRTNVTVVVVDGHLGPPLIIQHPTDGRFIECDVRTALALHQQVPLRLVKVVSRDCAHFEVATPFAPAMRWLPIPPYEVPEGDGGSMSDG